MGTKWRNSTWKIGFLLAVLIFVGCRYRHNEPQPWRVAVTYIGPHELINQIVAGFRTGMGYATRWKACRDH